MKDNNLIFQSLAMIEEMIQEKLTVEKLAEGIHFSKYHYQRIFRETVGETVMGYVIRRRLFLAAGGRVFPEYVRECDRDYCGCEKRFRNRAHGREDVQ